MGRSGGAREAGTRGSPAGSANGGLTTVAETDGVDGVSASPSSSPSATRLLQEQNLLDDAAHQHPQQHHMLAAQAQVANLFGGPGGLQQAQAALQAHATLRQRRQPCRQVSTSIADYVLKHDSRFEDTPSGVGVSASSMGHRRRQGSIAIRVAPATSTQVSQLRRRHSCRTLRRPSSNFSTSSTARRSPLSTRFVHVSSHVTSRVAKAVSPASPRQRRQPCRQVSTLIADFAL